jgi:hypothetical protein
MTIIGLIRCLLFPHAPNRRMVKKLPSGDYIGYCHFCNARIRRLKRDRWVRDWKRILSFGRQEEGEDSPEGEF